MSKKERIIRVLHFSPHNENCGIGKYQERFLEAMGDNFADRVANEFFDSSPYKTRVMNKQEFADVAARLKQELAAFDILHIQHEISFFRHNELATFVDIAQSLGKKIMITIHTAPSAGFKKPRRGGYGPRSIIHYLRQLKAAHAFQAMHVTPLKAMDAVIVHNKVTKQDVEKFGVEKQKIIQVTMPVPGNIGIRRSTEIHEALQYQPGDVIVSLVGFQTKTKGVKAAVKMLNYLPSNYKLALIGGIHPDGDAERYIDEVFNIVTKDGLKDRVYMTGYIEDDDYQNALIRETNACIYPYDAKYYRYVSSAALTNALANGLPAIVYPTPSFVGMNKEQTDGDVVAITKSANYYELARAVQQANYVELSKAVKQYAKAHSYTKEAGNLIDIYQRIMKL